MWLGTGRVTSQIRMVTVLEPFASVESFSLPIGSARALFIANAGSASIGIADFRMMLAFQDSSRFTER